MNIVTINGKIYNMVNAPSGAKRYFIVGPDANVYGFETEAQRWDMVDVLRSQLEDAATVADSKPGKQIAAIRAELGPDSKTHAQRLNHRNQEAK